VCEELEAQMAEGRPVDLTEFGMLVDRLARTLQRLGLKRRPRDLNPPSLSDYLNGKCTTERRARD
jgi:hypothetical protein